MTLITVWFHCHLVTEHSRFLTGGVCCIFNFDRVTTQFFILLLRKVDRFFLLSITFSKSSAAIMINMSSAKVLACWNSKHFSKSLRWMIKRRKPRQEPWCTPCVMSFMLDRNQLACPAKVTRGLLHNCFNYMFASIIWEKGYDFNSSNEIKFPL